MENSVCLGLAEKGVQVIYDDEYSVLIDCFVDVRSKIANY